MSTTHGMNNAPQLSARCPRISIKNNLLQLDYEFVRICCERQWTLQDAKRINEAHRYGLPMSGRTAMTIRAANIQIRLLLAEARQHQGSLAEWVVVEPKP